MGGFLGGLSRIAEQAGEADLYKQNRARELQTQDINDQISKAQLRLMQIQAQQEGQPKTTAFRDNKTGALQVLTTWPDGRVSFKSFGGSVAAPAPDVESMLAPLSADDQKKYGPTIRRLALSGNTKEAESFLEKVLLASGKPASSGSSTQAGVYRAADGKSIPAFRDPKNQVITDTAGNVLKGGTFYASSLMPTVSQGTAFQVTMDANGNPVITQVPVERRSQKVAPGTSAEPSPVVPRGGKTIALKPEPLSPQAKQALETVDTGLAMTDRLQTALEDSGMAQDGSVEARAKIAYEWAKYRAGFSADPPYNSIIPTAALLRVILTTPYLRGLRNFDYVRQIQQHIPGPTDTPKNMAEKMAQLRQNIPLLVDAIRKTEQPGLRKNAPRPAKQSSAGSRVAVVDPKGHRGTIPVSQLREALREGYKRAR